MLATVSTHLTVNGSVYIVSESFGVTFVTRSSDHGIHGLPEGPARLAVIEDVTHSCDRVDVVERWSGSEGGMRSALRIYGGHWDGVLTGTLVGSDPALVG